LTSDIDRGGVERREACSDFGQKRGASFVPGGPRANAVRRGKETKNLKQKQGSNHQRVEVEVNVQGRKGSTLGVVSDTVFEQSSAGGVFLVCFCFWLQVTGFTRP
jgi:hypothetical protein